jgi:hypothetical protein
MPRPKNSQTKPYSISQRNDSKTFQITLNLLCGLPQRVCDEWKRRSFKDMPDELANFRYPETKSAAKAGASALIFYLKKRQAAPGA